MSRLQIVVNCKKILKGEKEMAYRYIAEQLQKEYTFEQFVPIAQQIGFWYLAKQGFWSRPMEPASNPFQYDANFVTIGQNYNYSEYDVEEMIQATLFKWYEKEDKILKKLENRCLENCIRYFIGMLRRAVYDLYRDQSRRDKYEKEYYEKYYYPKLVEDFTRLIHLKLSINTKGGDEEEIVRLIQHGYNIKEIAASLGVSKNTIHRRLKEIRIRSEHFKPPKRK